MSNKIIGFVAVAILLLGGLFIAGRYAAPSDSSLTGAAGNISADNYYDFGKIRMTDGNVEKTFALQAPADRGMLIEKVYTSCMCTTAALILGEKVLGPYGMPGHGIVPAVNGPAGIGIMERFVTVESDAGDPIIYKIRAEVTP